MVVIIDDREDVWQWAPNLIRVKPFVFFEGFGDLNAPEVKRGENSKRDRGLKRKKVSVGGVEMKCLKVEQNDRDNNRDEERGDSEDANKKSEETSSVIFCIGDDLSKRNTGDNDQSNSENDENKSDKKQTNIEVETEVVKNEEVGNGGEDDEKKVSMEQSKTETAESKNTDITKIDEEQKPTEEKNDDSQFKKPRSILKASSKENVRKGENATESDNYLLHLESILMRVHARFYSVEEPLKAGMDLKKIIPQERSKVLKGCKIVFSGVVPMNTLIKQSWVHHLAVRHGAEVMERVVKGETTHVVGVRDGTEKVRQALRVGNVKVVNFDWLVESVERWMAQDESKYAMNKGSKWFLWYRNNLASRGFARGHFVTPKNDFLIDKTLKEEIFSSNGFEEVDVEESNEDESWLEKMMEDFKEADEEEKDEEETEKDDFDDSSGDEKNDVNIQKEGDEMDEDTSSSGSNGSETENDMAKMIEDKFCNHD